MTRKEPLCPQEAAQDVARLMHDRLGIHLAPLGAMLDRAGRRLPRAVRAEAEWLAAAAQDTTHPRRSHCYDAVRVKRARAFCLRELERIDTKADAGRRRAGMLAGIAFNLLVVLGGFLIAVAVLN